MNRCFAVLVALTFICTSAAAGPEQGSLRVRVGNKPDAGVRDVILAVYAAREGGTPLATESRSVRVDANGALTVPLGSVAWSGGSAEGERWLALQIPPGAEAPRVMLSAGGPATVYVLPPAAISGNGIVESASGGFRFPDGSVQTSAATVSGGVPSVNGIGAAVTIAAAGTASVGTVGSTITITGTGISYLRTVIVSPVPNNAVASGTALLNAMNGISGNSSTNPYLLKIEPGVYNIGSSQLVLKDYVDVEGSGEMTTYIVAAHGDNTDIPPAAAILGSNTHCEIRHLTVTNSGVTTLIYGVGIWAAGGTLRVRDVTVNNSAGNNAYGIGGGSNAILQIDRTTVNASPGGGAHTYGVLVGGSSAKVELRNSAIVMPSGGTAAFVNGPDIGIFNSTVTGGGISVSGAAKATVVNSTIKDGGVFVDIGGDAELRYSSVLSGTLASNGGPSSLRIGHSFLTLTGLPAGSPGYIICVASYSGAYALLNGLCQ